MRTISLNGYYGFRNVPVGEYRISVTAPRYKTIHTTVTLTDTSGAVDLIMSPVCDPNEEKAEKDILEGRPKLMIPGGIRGPEYSFADRDFERMFGVQYVSHGCIAPSYACVALYNKHIFNYLDKKFGDVWRRFARYDVIGLE
jgi:hypothetical protein